LFLRPDESETRRRWIKWTERQLCTTCAAGDGAGSGAEMDVLNRNDETFMRMALREACKAADQNEVPVGAVVVANGQVVARAFNQVEMLQDATAHAEILALTQASSALGCWRLLEATLYVTKEPCAMCAGAMVNSRLSRVVFGVGDPRSGAAGGALDITGFPGMLHQVEVTAGVLQEECLDVLRSFFERRRQEEKDARQEKNGD